MSYFPIISFIIIYTVILCLFCQAIVDHTVNSTPRMTNYYYKNRIQCPTYFENLQNLPSWHFPLFSAITSVILITCFIYIYSYHIRYKIDYKSVLLVMPLLVILIAFINYGFMHLYLYHLVMPIHGLGEFSTDPPLGS